MFKRVLDIYSKVLEKIITGLMYILIIAVALQVAGRYIPFIPRFLWTVDAVNFSLIWVIFLGSILAVRENRHFFVDFLPSNLPARINFIIRIVYFAIMFTVTLIFVIYGFKFLKMGMIRKSETMGINLGFVYASVLVAGISWFIFLIENIYNEFFLYNNTSKEDKP